MNTTEEPIKKDVLDIAEYLGCNGEELWLEISKLLKRQHDFAITKELQEAAKQMTEQPIDSLEESEKWEWYGYLRALRDIANYARVLNNTDIQERLEKRLAELQSAPTKKEVESNE